MWNALRSDFQEFVSTVTEDTSNVLSKLDAGMGTEDDDDDDDDIDNEDADAEENEDGEKKREVNHAELKEIMKLLRDHPGTYTEPLLDEDDKEAVEEYLANFSIDAKTDDIAQILKDHEDTVKKHFEDVCPTQVSYEEFWKRYFYRCDEDRIAQQLQEESERSRQARAEAIEGGIKTVTNFFGGAVKAVTDTIAPEDGHTTGQQGINFFGAKGRPPFVMNTAVSESGDEDLQEEDDDDEELGWDDDDDDDFLDGTEEDHETQATTTEQIEFTDKVSEDLQEKLKQAIEERDQIQQTVQMQAAEIKSLQGKLTGNPDIVSGEVEELKLKLFEKDAELAALKAKGSDDAMEDGGDKVASLAKAIGKLPSDQLAQLRAQVFGGTDDGTSGAGAEKISLLERQVQQLTQKLDRQEAALAAANDKLAATTRELESSRSKLSSDQASAQSASVNMKALEAKLKITQQSLEASQVENEQLRKTYEKAQQVSASQETSLKQQLATVQESASSLARQYEEATEKLKLVETELAAAKQAPSRATPPTPDTVSTGVKVEAAPPVPATKLALDDDDGDDWGDDWD